MLSLLSLAGGAGSACAALAGADEWGSTEGTGASGSSSSNSGHSSSSGAGAGGGGGGGGSDATCVDGIENGTETGVDCGGDCPACNAPCQDGDTIGQCVAVAPAGWTGPVIFAAGAVPPGCSGAWGSGVLDLGIDVDAPPLECSACACGPPAGQMCGGAFVSLFTQSGCNGAGTPYPMSALGCFNLNPPMDNVKSMSTSDALVSGGGCAASGGQVQSTPEASFTTRGHACSAPPIGGSSMCSSGDVCVPEAPVGFQRGCIYQVGEHDCPAEYTSKTTLYQDLMDDRACLGCTCSSPANGTCSAIGYAYGSTSCASQLAMASDGGCANVPTINPKVVSVRVVSEAVDGGSCAPAGGGSTGSVVGTNPTTVCCP